MPFSESNSMTFRIATTADIAPIMEIVADAQLLLRSLGIDQWQDGYPTSETILGDISRSEMYVATCEEHIVAMAVISFSGEPTYRVIKGSWLNNQPYAVVHRIAVRQSAYGRNIGREILMFAEQLCHEKGIENIRIDTHRDNLTMQHLLSTSGYRHCGTITLASGANREAYQKILQ